MTAGSRRPGRPMRILFQELTPGTARKAQARSADAPSGGGARDIRIRPHSEVREFMERLFPRERVERRRSREGGAEAPITIRVGTATWGDGRVETELEYWPPTNARPGEGRITRISSLPPLANPPEDPTDVVVLFVQDEEGLIWVRYATLDGLERSLPEVRDRILRCLDNPQGGRIATGYIDLSEDGLGDWCRGDLREDLE